MSGQERDVEALRALLQKEQDDAYAGGSTVGLAAHEVPELIADWLAERDAAIRDEAKAEALAPIRALADEWERDEAYRCRNAAECIRCVSFQRVALGLRALLDGGDQ